MKLLKIKAPIIGIFTGFVNGLLGSGGGTIIVPALEFFQKLEEHKAHATAIAVILPITTVSTIIYLFKGVLNLNAILWVGAGSILGSLLGAYLLNKVPANLLSKIFGVVLILASVRMIFL